MNTKIVNTNKQTPRNDGYMLTILAVLVIALSTSACGMKRALTLPKDEETSQNAQPAELQLSLITPAEEVTPVPTFYSELASATSIDVLKSQKITK
jgi:predicted small lipoprotein YifL